MCGNTTPKINQIFEIVTPQIISLATDVSNATFPRKLLVAVRMKRKKLILRLKKSARHVAKENGTRIDTKCLYRGKIFGDKSSHISVLLCKGISGIIQTSTVSYEIDVLKKDRTWTSFVRMVQVKHSIKKAINRNSSYLSHCSNSNQ